MQSDTDDDDSGDPKKELEKQYQKRKAIDDLWEEMMNDPEFFKAMMEKWMQQNSQGHSPIED